MSNRKRLVSKLDMVHALCVTRERSALSRAANAKAATDAARIEQETARQDYEVACRNWDAAATQSALLDPTLLGSWLHEISRLSDEYETAATAAAERADADQREHRFWRAATVEVTSASRVLKRARRRFDAQLEERRLNDQADELSVRGRLQPTASLHRRT